MLYPGEPRMNNSQRPTLHEARSTPTELQQSYLSTAGKCMQLTFGWTAYGIVFLLNELFRYAVTTALLSGMRLYEQLVSAKTTVRTM